MMLVVADVEIFIHSFLQNRQTCMVDLSDSGNIPVGATVETYSRSAFGQNSG